MAKTITPNRPSRLIRLKSNAKFLVPPRPIRPLTLQPIKIKLPEEYWKTCIHRRDFKNIHADLLEEYAKQYDIEIDHEKVLREETIAALCMKNAWIPLLPKHHLKPSGDGRKQLFKVDNDVSDDDSIEDEETEAYVPDRLATPEDSYDDEDMGPTDEALTNETANDSSDSDIMGDFDLDNFSPADLANLTSRLQARHAQVQIALRNATSATREASADVFEMMAVIEIERAKMSKVLRTMAEMVGENEEVMTDEDLDEAIGEVDEDDDSKAICACDLARSLSELQSGCTYQCVEHMPNSYKANESQGSRVPTTATASSSGSARNGKGKRTIPGPLCPPVHTTLFGLTNTSAATSNPSSKGKKRAFEETEDDEGSSSSSNASNKSPKRARVEECQDEEINSQKNCASSSTTPPRNTVPLEGTVSAEDPEEVANAKEAAPLRRRFTIKIFNESKGVAEVARLDNLWGPGRRILQSDDPEQSSTASRRCSQTVENTANDEIRGRSTLTKNVAQRLINEAADTRRDATSARTGSTPRRRNAPLRYSHSVFDLNDPLPATLTQGTASGSGMAAATATSSSSILGKRARDEDNDEKEDQERAQKKARIKREIV